MVFFNGNRFRFANLPQYPRNYCLNNLSFCALGFSESLWCTLYLSFKISREHKENKWISDWRKLKYFESCLKRYLHIYIKNSWLNKKKILKKLSDKVGSMTTKKQRRSLTLFIEVQWTLNRCLKRKHILSKSNRLEKVWANWLFI
jgi:hypothetical protein